eukprot:jgi/Botrbrau1/12730/Bobra.67_1s0090.1
MLYHRLGQRVLDVPTIKARATSLEKALDILLNPILSHMEIHLSRGVQMHYPREPGPPNIVPREVTWDNVDLADVVHLLPLAADYPGAPCFLTVQAGITSLLGLLHAISVAGENMELPVPPPLFEVSSVNRLLRLVARATSVDPEDLTPEVVTKQWRLFGELAASLGLQPNEHLAVALSPASKLLMVHFCSITTNGIIKLDFQAPETMVLSGGMRAAKEQNLMDIIGPCLLLPQYREPGDRSPLFESQEFGDLGHELSHNTEKFFMHAARELVGLDRYADQVEPEADSLFVYNASAGKFWINPHLSRSSSESARYIFAGWLMGQLFTNRTYLGIPLPEVLFEKLLHGKHFKASIEALSEFDTEAAASIRNVIHMREDEYKALLEQEGLPLSMSRMTYMRRAIREISSGQHRLAVPSTLSGVFPSGR